MLYISYRSQYHGKNNVSNNDSESENDSECLVHDGRCT